MIRVKARLGLRTDAALQGEGAVEGRPGERPEEEQKFKIRAPNLGGLDRYPPVEERGSGRR